jgi:hypothetical protein
MKKPSLALDSGVAADAGGPHTFGLASALTLVLTFA